MAQVFRPSYHITPPSDARYFMKDGVQWAKFRMRKTGRMVQGPVMKSGAASIKSEYYYCHMKVNGKKVRVPLHVTDQEAALQIRAKLVKEGDRRVAGLDDPRLTHAATPLAEHLDLYRDHMVGADTSDDHIKESIAIIQRLLSAMGTRYIEEFSVPAMNRCLATMKRCGRSARTRNKYLKTIRAFIRWMIHTDRMATDPLRAIDLADEQADQRHTRRALTPEELIALTSAAECGPSVRCIPGPTRALIYTLAATTGLRAVELARLKVSNLHLDDATPYLFCPPTVTKNRKNAIQPLHPQLVVKLLDHIQSLQSDDPLFDLRTESGDVRDTDAMMRKDTKAAGIPYQNEEGFADFHALRTTFATAVCMITDSFTATSLIRHSSPAMTAKHYFRSQLEHKAGVIAQLPV